MVLLRLPVLPVLFTLLFSTAFVSSTCYFPDGSIQDAPAFVACDLTVGTVSMCCGTNWTANNPKVANDKCEVNGLCLNSDNNQPLYWRGSCTDPTWKSPYCLKNLCTEFSEGGDSGSNVAVSQCDDGTWCCGGGLNGTCCYEKLGVKIASTLGQPISSSTTSSVPASSSTTPATSPASTSSSTTTSAISNPTNTDQSTADPSKKSSGLSTGAKAGIGIGVAVVAIAALGAVVFFILKSRRGSAAPAVGEVPKPSNGEYYAPSAEPSELGYYGPPKTMQHELGANRQLAELS